MTIYNINSAYTYNKFLEKNTVVSSFSKSGPDRISLKRISRTGTYTWLFALPTF